MFRSVTLRFVSMCFVRLGSVCVCLFCVVCFVCLLCVLLFRLLYCVVFVCLLWCDISWCSVCCGLFVVVRVGVRSVVCCMLFVLV